MARALQAPGRAHGQARVPRPVTTARRPVRLPSRRPRAVSRPWPATATAALRVRRLPKRLPRPGPPRSRTPRPGGCRPFRRRPCPGRLTRGLRMLRLTPGRRVPRGCPDHRGLRPRQLISAAREPARREPARPGLRLHVPARQVARQAARQAISVPVARVAARTRPKAARVPGQERRVRVRPGPGLPAPVRVARVPVPGRATTRSARPRPAWARRPRPGRKLRAPLARVRVPDRPALRRAAPVGRVPPDAVPGVPVTAVRAPVARVRVAPGRAR
jgi:hypothetical protein